MKKIEKEEVVKRLDNDELLDMLVRYSKYSDVMACEDEEKSESYSVIYDEVKRRMEVK